MRALEGPVPGVADLLEPGSHLELILQEGPPQIVVAVNAQAEVAGSIVPTTRLLQCLQQGVEFLAIVLTVNGGAIQLQVGAKP